MRLWLFNRRPCRMSEHEVYTSGVTLQTRRGGRRRRVSSYRCQKCKRPVVRHPIQTHLWLACQNYDEVNDK